MYTGPLLTGGFITGYELRKRIFDRQGEPDRVA
jgi:hypothetical protein